MSSIIYTTQLYFRFFFQDVRLVQFYSHDFIAYYFVFVYVFVSNDRLYPKIEWKADEKEDWPDTKDDKFWSLEFYLFQHFLHFI